MSQDSMERAREKFGRLTHDGASYIGSIIGSIVGPIVVLVVAVLLIIWIGHWSRTIGLFLSAFVVLGMVSSLLSKVFLLLARRTMSKNEVPDGFDGFLIAMLLEPFLFICAVLVLYMHFFPR